MIGVDGVPKGYVVTTMLGCCRHFPSASRWHATEAPKSIVTGADMRLGMLTAVCFAEFVARLAVPAAPKYAPPYREGGVYVHVRPIHGGRNDISPANAGCGAGGRLRHHRMPTIGVPIAAERDTAHQLIRTNPDHSLATCGRKLEHSTQGHGMSVLCSGTAYPHTMCAVPCQVQRAVIGSRLGLESGSNLCKRWLHVRSKLDLHQRTHSSMASSAAKRTLDAEASTGRCVDRPPRLHGTRELSAVNRRPL